MKLVNSSVRKSATITTSLSRKTMKLSCFFAFFPSGAVGRVASVGTDSFVAAVILARSSRVKARDRAEGVDTVDGVLGENAKCRLGRGANRRNPPKFRVCNHRPAA